jgi:hypothetical protein
MREAVKGEKDVTSDTEEREENEPTSVMLSISYSAKASVSYKQSSRAITGGIELRRVQKPTQEY